MLLNTSFNIMGKPIMHSVEDAIGLFYTTGLGALVIEDYLIEKVSRPDGDRIRS
jgi:carbamoyltransferase